MTKSLPDPTNTDDNELAKQTRLDGCSWWGQTWKIFIMQTSYKRRHLNNTPLPSLCHQPYYPVPSTWGIVCLSRFLWPFFVSKSVLKCCVITLKCARTRNNCRETPLSYLLFKDIDRNFGDKVNLNKLCKCLSNFLPYLCFHKDMKKEQRCMVKKYT